MPAIQSNADKVYIFQQDRGLAHYVRQTVELLLLLTRGRPTAQTLNQLITAFGNRCMNESSPNANTGRSRAASRG